MKFPGRVPGFQNTIHLTGFMRFKKYCSLIPLLMVFLLFAGYRGSAQGYYFYNNGYYESDFVIEAGLAAGVMNGMTDVGGSKNGKANSGFMGDFTFTKSKMTGGIYAVGTYRDWLGVRLDLNIGKLEAADSTLKGTTSKWAQGRYVRNLSFRTSIFEIGAGIEIHPLMWPAYTEREPPRLSPYLIAGVGWLKFNPQANLNGVWYDLEPLRLEGQGFSEYPDRLRYHTNAFEFPYGIGFRYEATQYLNIRLEMTRHTTTTDYLDDVSKGDWVDPALFYKYLTPANAAIATQLYNRSTIINPPRNTRPRGNPKDKDAFWNVSLKVGININRLRNNGFKGPLGKVRCPGTQI
jgi:hypothetical protein